LGEAGRNSTGNRGITKQRKEEKSMQNERGDGPKWLASQMKKTAGGAQVGCGKGIGDHSGIYAKK